MDYSDAYADGLRPLRYSAEDIHAFLRTVRENPTDSTPRRVLADYLEENHPEAADEATLHFLRNHRGYGEVHLSDDGRISVRGPWKMSEIRAASQAAGGHFFDRDTMRFFGARLLPKEIYHGPGGVYFVHESDNFDRSRRELRIAGFNPDSKETFHPATYFVGAHDEPFDSLDDARIEARRLASEKQPTHPWITKAEG